MAFARFAAYHGRNPSEEQTAPTVTRLTATQTATAADMPTVTGAETTGTHDGGESPPTYSTVAADPAPIYRRLDRSPPPPYNRDGTAGPEDVDAYGSNTEDMELPDPPLPALVRVPARQNPFSRRYIAPAPAAATNVIVSQTVVVDMAPGQLEAGDGAQQRLQRVQRRRTRNQKQSECGTCGITLMIIFLVVVALFVGGLALIEGATKGGGFHT